MRRRGRSISETNLSEDAEAVKLALQRLCSKLRAAQPSYAEDDVAEIPFVAEGSSSTSSITGSHGTSPRHSGGAEDGADLRSSEGLVTAPLTSSSSSPSGGVTAGPSSSGAAAREAPLSAALYLTAVNLFDPKTMVKSRRAASVAVQLLQQGYALVWQDPGYLEQLSGPPGPRDLSPSRAAAVPQPLLRLHRPRAASSPTPTYQPPTELVALLDHCVQELLVYGNTSAALCQLLIQEDVLRLLCFVGTAARREEAEGDLGRDVELELKELTTFWASCGLTGRLVDTLVECYLLDFLLDCALPPAVCSARYEGLADTLLDKKDHIIRDMVSSRQGFAILMSKTPLQGLAGLTAMSAHTEAKVRMRFLDKMVTEGLVERLAAEMRAAVSTLLQQHTDARGPHSPSSRQQSATVSPSKRGRTSASPSKVSPPRAKQRTSAPPAAAKRYFPLLTHAVDRLGLCIDILLQLMRPNLRSPYEVQEAAGAGGRSSAPSIVRATVWATKEKPLREICGHLLWLVCHNHTATSSLVRSLQEQAADCLLYLASYSGFLYGMVVESIDSLLDGTLILGETARGAAGVDVEVEDVGGLLPLLLPLLSSATHAEANATSVRQWFQQLAADLLPQVFEAPTLTSGRRSSALWGQKRKGGGGGGSSNASTERPRAAAPVLARDLTRAELRTLSPYFSFATRLVTETPWRDGAEPFLAKIALLSYHVVVSHHRATLVFGQACHCYRVVAPLMEPVQGRPPGSEPPRTPSGKAPKDVTPADDDYFIPSPVRSPVFYETYSPPSGSKGRSGSSSPSSRQATTTTATTTTEADGASPESVTRTWRDRLSLRQWLSSLGGRGSGEEGEDEDATGVDEEK